MSEDLNNLKAENQVLKGENLKRMEPSQNDFDEATSQELKKTKKSDPGGGN